MDSHAVVSGVAVRWKRWDHMHTEPVSADVMGDLVRNNRAPHGFGAEVLVMFEDGHSAWVPAFWKMDTRTRRVWFQDASGTPLAVSEVK